MTESKEFGLDLTRPTPTQFVTDVGVLAIAPELRQSAEMVFSGVKMGMDLDDFWDFGVQPRPQTNSQEHLKNGNVAESMALYDKYFKSYGSHLEKIEKSADSPEKQRQSDNTGWFVSSIHFLEGTAISQDKSYWNPETVSRYRESVALVWAMFMSSLAKDSKVDLYDVANNDGKFSLEKCITWMEDQGTDDQLEKLYTKRMFYSALVFQVVSDYGKRNFAKEQFIPSFGGIGFEEYSDRDLLHFIENKKEEYLKGAIDCGVEPMAMKIFLSIFPLVQKLLNRIKKSKSVSEWAYS